MQKRKLGNSGLKVSAIRLGCLGMSYGYEALHKKPVICPNSRMPQLCRKMTVCSISHILAAVTFAIFKEINTFVQAGWTHKNQIKNKTLCAKSGYDPAEDKQEMISLLRSAVERGVTFFHTAEAYGLSTNKIRGILK